MPILRSLLVNIRDEQSQTYPDWLILGIRLISLPLSSLVYITDILINQSFDGLPFISL
jgi:hypothetical protein